MKKLYFSLTILLVSLTTINSNAQTIVWTDTFTSGVNPTPAQITNWNNFRAQLLSSYCYTKMTISGTFDTAGQVCNDPTIVLAYANALRTLSSYTSPLTNGNVWSLCGTRYQGEVWLNPPSECSPSNCPFGYIIRPGGPGSQYGGVNSNTCSPPSQTMTFTFEYQPTGPPTVTCPSNITVNNDNNTCGAVVNYSMPSVLSCDTFTTTQTSGLASGSTFPVGTTTNTFSYTNGSGTSTCSFTVTVNDTEIPTISCPSNVVSCVPVVNNIAPTAADNCSGETVTYTLTGATAGTGSNDASGSTFNQGITTVKYIVTDASGNKDSCSFNVEVLPAIDVTVTNASPSLTSNENGATYQWLDCDNNFSIITGATSQTFNASANGNYAVEVTVGNCVDTSACESVNNVGINENDLFNGVSIFPNPTNNIINITLNAIDKANLTVYTIDGKVVYQNNNITEKQTAIDLSNNSKGIYFLKVEANNQNKVYKVIKE